MGDNEHVQTLLGAMDLSVGSADLLFSLIDLDGNGDLTLEELVKGVGRLKGDAKSWDVLNLIRIVTDLQESVEKIQAKVCGSNEGAVLKRRRSLGSLENI